MAERGTGTLENLGLACGIALKFRGRGIPAEDLKQIAVIGLIEAARRFDPGRGIAFSTYASYWVRKELSEALCDGGFIRIPRYLRKGVADLAAGRTPTPYAPRRGANPNYAELSALALASTKRAGAEYLDRATARHEPFEAAERAELMAAVRRRMTKLPERHRKVIEWRYDRSETLAEVGARLGVTKERVRQIEVEALAQLRGGDRD